MSSPVHDDGDKRAMYIPPWAREERDDEETRRLQAEIVAAAERLKPPAPPRAPVSAPLQQKASVPSPAFQTRYNGDRRNSDASGDTFKIEDAIREAWSPGGLDPVPMPPPPKPGGPTFGMVSRLAGAVGFAGIVALFVTGAIPLPSIDISMSSDSKDANAAAPAAPAGSELALANTRPHPALAPANPAAQPTPAVLRTPAQPPQSAAPTVGAVVATAPVAPEPPKVKPPQAEAPRPASAIPEPRVLDYMSKEEIEFSAEARAGPGRNRRYFQRQAAVDPRRRSRRSACLAGDGPHVRCRRSRHAWRRRHLPRSRQGARLVHEGRGAGIAGGGAPS